MKNKNKRILISGASLAGPTLAFWLAKYGFGVTLVERTPALRSGGNGIDVRGLAIEVAKRMGIWPQIKASALDATGILFVNGKGKAMANINIKAMQGKNKSEEVELLRGDLSSILYQLTNDRVEYIFGDSIKSLESRPEEVQVTFESGLSRIFDLVIGADGIHSNVRRLVFGPESQFMKFKRHYFAFANASASLGKKGWLTGYNVPGRFVGISKYHNQSGAKSYFAFRSEQLLDYDYRDVEGQKQILKENFEDLSWHVSQLLRDAMADPDFYFDSLSQVVMPAWSSERIALVGDAAFCASPVTGAGATLSLVGAYHLAGELAQADGDYKLAFKSYEACYRKTTETSQAQLFTGLLVPKSRLGIWTRNTLTKLPVMGALARMERKLNFKKTEMLPDYR